MPCTTQASSAERPSSPTVPAMPYSRYCVQRRERRDRRWLVNEEGALPQACTGGKPGRGAAKPSRLPFGPVPGRRPEAAAPAPPSCPAAAGVTQETAAAAARKTLLHCSPLNKDTARTPSCGGPCLAFGVLFPAYQLPPCTTTCCAAEGEPQSTAPSSCTAPTHRHAKHTHTPSSAP